jgi:putative membrane protein
MTNGQLLLSAWHLNIFLIAVCVWALLVQAVLCDLKFTGKYFLFITGILFFFLALDSPISELADGYLFSAHMIQHFLLVLIVPPLLLLGMTFSGKRLIPIRRLFWSPHPLVGWFSGVGAMWVWHIPALCDAAVTHKAVLVLQITSLLFLGLLFWKPIVSPRIEERLTPLAGIIYLFTACVACTLLGIWISFSPVSVCPVFMSPDDKSGLLPMIRDQWHLTPAIDQQIGGLLMWVPACLVYLGAILVLLGRFYRRPEKRKK